MDQIDQTMCKLCEQGVILAQCPKCKTILNSKDFFESKCSDCNSLLDKGDIIIFRRDKIPQA
jgi:exosome complex RNA-binding protein Csl4